MFLGFPGGSACKEFACNEGDLGSIPGLRRSPREGKDYSFQCLGLENVCPWNSPGKNTGVGRHALLQRIFATQGWNPGLPHCRQILYQMSPYREAHQSCIYMSISQFLPPCPQLLTSVTQGQLQGEKYSCEIFSLRATFFSSSRIL